MSYVGMIERRQNLGFALEAAHPVRIAEECHGQNFDRHVTFEHRVARAVNLAHAAWPKRHKRNSDKFSRSARHPERALSSRVPCHPERSEGSRSPRLGGTGFSMC